MRWRKDGPHLAVSNEGYKVARYMVGANAVYRPSLHGSFICAPLADPKDAQAECERHFKASQNKAVR